MKKYYHTRIYQASVHKAFFISGEPFKKMIVFKEPNENYKFEAEYTLVNTDEIIIIEKIFPYLVREVKTGIIFPIVNFKKESNINSNLYISHPFGLVHTFVASENGKLVANEVNSPLTLEENQLHPDVNLFKHQLLEIINRGKTNMDAKLRNKQYQKNKQKQEDNISTEEKQKIIHHFKQKRKGLK